MRKNCSVRLSQIPDLTPQSNKDFQIPPKIEFAKTDADTGYLALPSCPKVILEAFKEGTVPTEFCPYDHTKDVVSDSDEALE